MTANLPKMIAESEPTSAVVLATPQRPQSWPGCLEAARREHAFFAARIAEVVEVINLVDESIAHDDAWLRDTGPIFVRDPAGNRRVVDFRFNNWGASYGDWSRDDTVADAIAKHLNLPCTRVDLSLEGGGLEVAPPNHAAAGTLITTAPCILNDNRNPGLTQTDAEAQLRQHLGVAPVIWLPKGLKGDETDGHVDNLARFATGNAVFCASAPADHQDHAACETNAVQLRDTGLDVIPLPIPEEPLTFEYPDDPAAADGYTGLHRLTASYTNYLLVNGVCFVPEFGRPAADERARHLIQEATGWDMVPIPCATLLVGGGGPHCLTCNVPA